MDYEYQNRVLDSLLAVYIENHDIEIEQTERTQYDGLKVKVDTFNGRFNSGSIVQTHTISNWVNEGDKPEIHNFKSKFLNLCLLRHLSGDWGKQCIEDFLMNEESLRYGERLMSVYESPIDKQVIWIITEWDRTVTTILDPSDY